MNEAIDERVKSARLKEKIIAPEEAAAFVKNGMRLATSGSTSSGYPLSFFKALAGRAKEDAPPKIELWSAAPLGPEIDGDLIEAGMIQRRLCHQANPLMAKAVNRGEIFYVDMGPSKFAGHMRQGFFQALDLSVIEAVGITEEGNIIPSTCISDGPSQIQAARNVIIEINTNLPPDMSGIHDVIVPKNPPFRQAIPINSPADRVGTPYIPLESNKVIGVILSDEKNKLPGVGSVKEESRKIAQHLIAFFEKEVSKRRMPDNLLPLQTGLGSLGVALLLELGRSRFTNLQTFSALLNDSILDLIDMGKITVASGSGLFFSAKGMDRFYRNIEIYKKVMILRPVDISTSPELIQRLGVIALNGAIEVDIYGHVNSTHIGGGRILTGVAGSIEYARNGYLSIFMTPSIGKRGDISRIVPMVSHVDHTEHDVDIIVTEQGLADLRYLSPLERAQEIINRCAHPDYKPLLESYLKKARKEGGGHEPQIMEEASSFHLRLKTKGSMKL